MTPAERAVASNRDVRPGLVAVVVLSFNGREDTLECLASLTGSGYEPLTTLVADNASTDGTAEAVAVEFPEVELIRNKLNLGFAEGNNIGIRRAAELGAEFVLVLNNDTIVASDAIGLMVRELQLRPDAGAVCPLICFAEDPEVIWYAGASFDAARARSGRLLGYRQTVGEQSLGVEEVDRAAGAAVLASMAALRSVGNFDRSFFLYYEDVEWSLRARRAGYRIYVVPGAQVWHKVSRSTGGEHSPSFCYYGTRNHLEVCRRYAPLTGVAALRRSTAILGVHAVEALRSPRPLAAARGVLGGALDYRRGVFGQKGCR